MPAFFLRDFRYGSVERPGAFTRPHVRQGIKHICDGHDAPFQRNVVTGQCVGMTAAVPVFVGYFQAASGVKVTGVIAVGAIAVGAIAVGGSTEERLDAPGANTTAMRSSLAPSR